jgi:FkbM family methyltransferase
VPLARVAEHTFMSQGVSRDSVVLDLGANRGGFSHAMIDRFGCRCIAVEANPTLCAAIRPHPRLTVVHAAVAPQGGELPFYVCREDEASSLLRRDHDNTVVETVMVPSRTIDELLTMHELAAVDLLKVDIEGAEIGVLESCSSELLCRIPQIAVEFHEWAGLIARSAVLETIARLERLGFNVIPMWMRAYGDTLFVNRKLASVGLVDFAWSRWVVRNWWGAKNYVGRKAGISI